MASSKWKYTLWLVALVATLTVPSRAQGPTPAARIKQSSLRQATSSRQILPDTGTGYLLCKPCLWYAGDFDSNNQYDNALLDGKDLQVKKAVVSVPFTVPKGKVWKITGALGAFTVETSGLDPAQADWSFSKNVSSGHAGQEVRSGTSAATMTYPGCNGSEGWICAGIVVNGINVALTAGKYWMTLVPYCTNPNDSACQGQQFFLLDEEDVPPLNHYGPKNVLDASYFTSQQHGAYYMPTWGPSGACGGTGCDMFSVGLMGTAEDDLTQ